MAASAEALAALRLGPCGLPGSPSGPPHSKYFNRPPGWAVAVADGGPSHPLPRLDHEPMPGAIGHIWDDMGFHGCQWFVKDCERPSTGRRGLLRRGHRRFLPVDMVRGGPLSSGNGLLEQTALGGVRSVSSRAFDTYGHTGDLLDCTARLYGQLCRYHGIVKTADEDIPRVTGRRGQSGRLPGTKRDAMRAKDIV